MEIKDLQREIILTEIIGERDRMILQLSEQVRAMTVEIAALKGVDNAN